MSAAEDLVEVTLRVPRVALHQVTPAVTVSQDTAAAILGIERVPFLRELPAYEAAGGEVIRVGRKRLVRVEPFLAYLAARSRVLDAGDAANDVDDEADAYGAELGIVSTPAPTSRRRRAS